MRGLVWLLFLMSAVVSFAQGGGGAAVSPNSPISDHLDAPAPPPPPVADQSVRGTIHGIVTPTTSAQGIANATVYLVGPSPSAGLPAIKKTVTSNSNGSFAFLDLPGGDYEIDAEREGFFPAGLDSGVNAVISANSKDTKVTVLLVAGGVISGRLHDSDDRPVSGMSISPMRAEYWNGHKVFVNRENWPKTTNDRGEFRLFWLPPGEYMVRTNAGIGGLSYHPTGGRTAPQLTFYPGVTEESQAIPLVVHAGEEVSGIDFVVEDAQAFSISGTVHIQIPGGTLQNGQMIRTVYLDIARDNGLPEEISQLINPIRTTDLNRIDFPFEAAGIPAGRYFMSARFQSDQAMYRAVAPVQVIDGNVTGINLDIRGYPDLEFHVRRQGIAGGITLAPRSMWAELRARGALSSFYAAEAPVQPDGTVVFPSINPAEYEISLKGIPGSFHLSDIRQRSLSLMQNAVVQVDGAERTVVDIVLGSGGGRVQGIVRNSLGQPTAGIAVLIPQPPFRQNPSLYNEALVIADGAFWFDDIPPGEYKIFAWQNLAPGAEKSPDFLSKYESRGRAVSIAAGSRLDDITVEVIAGE